MFKGGVKEAAKMLQKLTSKERERLLSEMEKKDARLAQLVRQNMLQFADLIHIDRSMLGELLRHLGAETIGLALRAADNKLIQHFLSLTSSNTAQDIQDVLKGKPRLASEVEQAQDKILSYIRPKLESGEYRFPEDDGPYV